MYVARTFGEARGNDKQLDDDFGPLRHLDLSELAKADFCPGTDLLGDAVGYKLERRDFFSESAVYGLVMVSALLVVTNQYEVTSRDVFIKVLGTTLVFWLAHVFATAVSHMGVVSDRKSPFRESFRYAIGHSVGMLVASVVPLAIVLLGVVNLIRDDLAVWTALWVDALLLGILGYLSAARWTAKTSARFAVGAGTSLLGICIVVLKAFMH